MSQARQFKENLWTIILAFEESKDPQKLLLVHHPCGLLQTYVAYAKGILARPPAPSGWQNVACPQQFTCEGTFQCEILDLVPWLRGPSRCPFGSQSNQHWAYCPIRIFRRQSDE